MPAFGLQKFQLPDLMVVKQSGSAELRQSMRSKGRGLNEYPKTTFTIMKTFFVTTEIILKLLLRMIQGYVGILFFLLEMDVMLEL